MHKEFIMKQIAIFLSLIVSLLGQTVLVDQPDFPYKQTTIYKGLPNGINLPDRLSKSGSADWRPIAQLNFGSKDEQWQARSKIFWEYSTELQIFTVIMKDTLGNNETIGAV